MPHLEGVDVSHANGEIDWRRVKEAGIAFAMIKATEGSSFVDPRMLTNLTGCREAGIVPASSSSTVPQSRTVAIGGRSTTVRERWAGRAAWC
jgi:hypothetical protein